MNTMVITTTQTARGYAFIVPFFSALRFCTAFRTNMLAPTIAAMTMITPPMIAMIAGPLWSDRPILLKKLLPDFFKRIVRTVAATGIVLGDDVLSAIFCVNSTKESSDCVIIGSVFVNSFALVTRVVLVGSVVVPSVVVVVVSAAFVVKREQLGHVEQCVAHLHFASQGCICPAHHDKQEPAKSRADENC